MLRRRTLSCGKGLTFGYTSNGPPPAGRICFVLEFVGVRGRAGRLKPLSREGRPAAISDWGYLAVSLLAGSVTFWRPSVVERRRSPVLLFDAAGLGLFAVAGTQKALSFGLNPVMAALLGMLTGIGGGMTRDVLLTEIPTVLRADLYAVAALAGAATVVIGTALRLPSTLVVIAGAVLCFVIRFMAIRRGWHLPIAGKPGQPTTPAPAPKDRKDDDARRL